MRGLSLRNSLHARLLLIALATSAIALLFAAWSIGNVLERFVLRDLDRSLDTQIEAIVAAVGPDGRLDRARLLELPAFLHHRRGWTWQVRGRGGTWSSPGASIVDLRIWSRPNRRRGPIRRGRAHTADGLQLHARALRYATPAGPVEIVATAPRTIADRPLRAALGPLLISLGLLGGGLGFATWVQLRYGLRPVRTLSAAVARVRSGAAERLPTDQPRELRPLAEEVNALIDQNAAGLEHARRHVANLAHGLKTPLATLSLQLARDGASADTRALVEQLDVRIRHHLRRARSAAPGAGERARAPVSEVAGDLIEALRHVHADRALRFACDVDPALHVAVDRQDLEEVLGNLLDNACRHARGEVRVAAASEAQTTVIRVEDDGEGMSDQDVARALRPGERLDESGVGYGFGLAIVQELADLYGGALALGRSAALGGLDATVTLRRH